MSETLATLPSAVRSTVSGALGDPLRLFAEPGPVYEADVAFDDDARMPGLTQLLRPGRRYTTFVRIAPTSTDAVVRTVCVKFPDAYGPGTDQDFLFASSGDGAPLHHFTFPRTRADDQLYSSLWLYLAGVRPVVFGVSAAAGSQTGVLGRGDRFEFLIGGVIGRFHRVGDIQLGSEIPQASVSFAASNSGGGLRPLPPVMFYRG
ncbi:hypothetical protein [Mycolicibacterium monacense]|uniref:Uncharacterized protein n=2 Tax=Mycobacteriaceae TaxID=1762 RepID=A0AAD1IUD6_MYCMB|nr:hypothetical protein [Mycolicibacterium monacense]MDA4102552.1 hypothetical protein [Mycolicibacterium monacense DSM 44395]ORB16921.1 hypothetical protein BST34_19000 [Mycolicibacterium monacense DSM 44395]QHP86620.1 hypothetical protein EWR22_15355 [Mycolicibacterium monacense DSM 44395]BBZ60328.1 hypothetical protein MMON_16290 [Mycolicibacterium monacense]